jgi:hypothetical protein
MEDKKIEALKAKYNAGHYPYEDRNFQAKPRDISTVNTQNLSPARVVLFNNVEAYRNADPMIGAKVAGKEIANNLLNAMKDKKGGVQVEGILAAIGSLAGRELLNGINAVLGSFVNEKETPEDAKKIRRTVGYAVGIVVADTESGQAYLFGDEIANRFCRFFYFPISPNAKIEDMIDIAKETAASVGENYWKTSFDETVGVSPKVLGENFGAVTAPSLSLFCRYPYERLIAYNIAAQILISQAAGVIEEKTALRILAEYGWKTSHFNLYF